MAVALSIALPETPVASSHLASPFVSSTSTASAYGSKTNKPKTNEKNVKITSTNAKHIGASNPLTESSKYESLKLRNMENMIMETITDYVKK